MLTRAHLRCSPTVGVEFATPLLPRRDAATLSSQQMRERSAMALCVEEKSAMRAICAAR